MSLLAGAEAALQQEDPRKMSVLRSPCGATLRAEAHFAAVLLMLTAASVSIAASQIALGLALLLLLLRRFIDQAPIPATGLGVITAALAGWALLNVPFSADPGQSLVFYRRFYLFAAIWAVAGVADSEARRRWLLGALVVGSVAISIYGLISLHRLVGGFWKWRLVAMSNSMTSGCVLMMALLVVLGFLLVAGNRRRLRWCLALAAVPIAFALAQTLTRSAWLGALAGCGVMLLLARSRLLGTLALAVFAAGFVIWTLPATSFSAMMYNRLNLTGIQESQTYTERVDMWRAGWRMIEANPWLGVGDHDLKRTAAPYYDGEPLDYGHLHNNQIMLAAIWGLPGFLLASLVLIWQLAVLCRAWRSRDGPDDPAEPLRRGWLLGAIGVWTGFFVAGLTEWYFGDAESMLLYLAIIGAALGGRSQRRRGVA